MRVYCFAHGLFYGSVVPSLVRGGAVHVRSPDLDKGISVIEFSAPAFVMPCGECSADRFAALASFRRNLSGEIGNDMTELLTGLLRSSQCTNLMKKNHVNLDDR